MNSVLRPTLAILLLLIAAGCTTYPAARSPQSGSTATPAAGGLTSSTTVYPSAGGSQPGGQPGGRQQPAAGLGPPGIRERVIYFDFDSADIRPQSRPVVEAHARYLAENPNAEAILEGHADQRGTREYNIALGERRAESVRRLMNAYGAAPRQLQTLSYGEERPAVAGEDEGSYSQNRRVEIVY